MFFGHSRRLMGAFWARRWCRRLTYLLATGSVLCVGTVWAVQRPYLNRWLISQLDEILRAETGLGLQAERLEVHPLQGRVILSRFSIGGDLLIADRLEVQAEPLSLLGNNPHVWMIELENPSSTLDAARLGRIHLKERPKAAIQPQLRLDQFRVYGGTCRIQEPAWNLPNAEFGYRIFGHGLGPNRFFVDTRIPRASIDLGSGPITGWLSLQANVSPSGLEVKGSELKLGGNHLVASGNYSPDARMMTASLRGEAALGELIRFVGVKSAHIPDGLLAFKGEAKGSVQDPAWSLEIQGKDLDPGLPGVGAGEVALKARGGLRQVALKELAWHSSQGNLQASGQWQKGKGTTLHLHTDGISLAPVASMARVDFLKGLSVDLTGDAEMPGDPWVSPKLELLKVNAAARLVHGGETAGNLAFKLAKQHLNIDRLELRVPEISLEATGSLGLNAKGLESATAEAKVTTDAARVSEVLGNWEIGEGQRDGRVLPLGMAGHAESQASVQWSEKGGLKLTGQVQVQEPRWHGATLDALRAEVFIQGDELRVENIEGTKGAGSASGELWLTWGQVPVGWDQLDTCYRGFRLPIEEGLKAADVGDLPITGLGSGWARIHGPFSRLLIEAGALAENGEVYGLKLPRVSGGMLFDLAGDRLQVKDFRVAESAEQLGGPDDEPTGLLALQGSMNMDLKHETWDVLLAGNVDSMPLGLPGPRFQAQLDAHLEGPWVSPLGPLPPVPEGSISISRGRLFLNDQSLEGLEGRLGIANESIQARFGMAGQSAPLINLDARSIGDRLTGALEVRVSPDTADTAHLASRLSQDLLKDAELDFKAEGEWNREGLSWKGRTERLAGNLGGINLVQKEPASFEGDASEARIDLQLNGSVAQRPGRNFSTFPTTAMRISGSLPFSSTNPMGLKLEGSAELANLKGVLDHLLEVDSYSLLADLQPEGTASLDLNLGGAYSAPSLKGLLELQEGRLQVRTYPQSVEDLDFKLHFEGRDFYMLESEPLKGRVAQGELQAWGRGTWDLGGLSQYDFHARLDDFQLRDLPEGFELNGTLDASLRGSDEEGGVLRGTLQAGRTIYQADINLKDLLLASAMGGGPLLPGANPDDPMARIALDLDVQLTEPWELDTNLLKLEGRPSGAFKIMGTLAEPGLKGKMDILPGGRLTNLLPAGDIVLERGTIDFMDPRSLKNAVLDLQGRVDVPPYLVNLYIRGSLDNLDMKETSTPSLRQDEITAILIDPSLASTIGSTSGPNSQTNAIATGFASTGSGLLTTLALANFQETLRKTLGLDRVSVSVRSGAGYPETTITIGKSVNILGFRTPLVFTNEKIGDPPVDTTKGQVEWRLGNFVLQLGASQSGSNGAGLTGEIRHTWIP